MILFGHLKKEVTILTVIRACEVELVFLHFLHPTLDVFDALYLPLEVNNERKVLRRTFIFLFFARASAVALLVEGPGEALGEGSLPLAFSSL